MIVLVRRRASGRRARAAAVHPPRRGSGMSQDRARAAAGSSLFFALAPGIVLACAFG